MNNKVGLLFFLLFLVSCMSSKLGNEGSESQATLPRHVLPVSYEQDIKPIFEQKCVVCHACYDAPCQLNLSSPDGLRRGAHKLSVYNGKRLVAATPTRLGIDASSEQEWRQLGFFSVLDSVNQEPSLMAKMLDLGRTAGKAAGVDEDISMGTSRANDCPTTVEFKAYASAHPHGGMPFVSTALGNEEYHKLHSWLAGGAVMPQASSPLDNDLIQQVNVWETFLNGKSKKERLVARYLYEHLFMGHLYFSELSKPRFFKVVRSRTPPGVTVSIIASIRPNDDPGSEFYYRLIPVNEAITVKTHVTYALNAKKMARFKQLFLQPEWFVAALPGYSFVEKANPFLTFQSIPVRSRYLFLLDSAAYFVDTFIRGPVCNGQLATDVIRDRFWTLFQAPDQDLFVIDAAYQQKVLQLLAVPGVQDDIREFVVEWPRYKKNNNLYMSHRQQGYAEKWPQGPDFEHIWNGEGNNASAAQTIFRHHNNAKVTTGLAGSTPRTMWVMDYPLLERSYYVLVANFNVFGNVAHHALTRMYFDLIRNGAEQNLLRFIPSEQRTGLIKNWYQDAAQLKLYMTYEKIDLSIPTAIDFHSENAFSEFSASLKRRYAWIETKNKGLAKSPHHVQSMAALSVLTEKTAGKSGFIKRLPDISLLRVYDQSGGRQLYSLVRDRAHTNVAFLLGESLRYLPDEDKLTIMPGIMGSYPNFMFNVAKPELEEFVDQLNKADQPERFNKVVKRWGVQRTHPEFWQLFADLSEYLKEQDPVNAGILDMNRYQNL